jgi:hypothetical protein
METVYKVQNMPLIADNIIHVAVSEEVVVSVDHHSVAVVDLSVEVEEVVLMVVIIKVLANHSIIMVHHQWVDVHLLLDQAEVSVVPCYEVVDDHLFEAAMDMMATLLDEDPESFAAEVVQC